MAPNVTVPMNFGKYLLSSPTHNTLKLNTSKGGVVCASSVILSFNSPVIDHMTTTLHMTSVDMLEFSETAVKVFVDAAYSGIVEGLNKEIFRDVNKMANVFEVSWLAEECSQYFSEIADSVQTASYPELLYIFDEAGFVFEHLGTKEFLKVAIKKIEMLAWKQQFLKEYLVNADRLTTKKLDMVIELAGEQVTCVVRTLCNQLNEQVNRQPTFVLPDYCRYLLDNSDLYSCKQSDSVLYEELFDVLEKLPEESLANWKWVHQLYRRSNNSGKRKKDYADGASSSTTLSRCNDIANLYHDFDYSMSYHNFLDWISTSETVRNMLMAIEAVWTWSLYVGKITGHFDYIEFSDLRSDLGIIQEKRGWKLLPYSFVNVQVELSVLDIETEDYNFDCNQFCHSPEAIAPSSVFIDCIETCSNPLFLLSKDARLTFHFKPPSVSHCDLPGECGFILKTIPRHTGLLNKLTLCVEKEDYHNRSVHFHEELKAEKMHIFVHKSCFGRAHFCPLSWLGSLIVPKHSTSEQGLAVYDFYKDCFPALSESRFRVLYCFD